MIIVVLKKKLPINSLRMNIKSCGKNLVGVVKNLVVSKSVHQHYTRV